MVHTTLALCQGVKDITLGRKAMMAVPMEVLLCVVGFLYTEVVRVLLGPGESRVSSKGMEPLSWGLTVATYMCG